MVSHFVGTPSLAVVKDEQVQASALDEQVINEVAYDSRTQNSPLSRLLSEKQLDHQVGECHVNYTLVMFSPVSRHVSACLTFPSTQMLSQLRPRFGQDPAQCLTSLVHPGVSRSLCESRVGRSARCTCSCVDRRAWPLGIWSGKVLIFQSFLCQDVSRS